MTTQVKVRPSGHEFLVEGHANLLQSGLHSGLRLNYGCGNGSCGMCKVRVIAGQVARMAHRQLFKDEQYEFADRALALRFEDAALAGMQPSALLAGRRVDDAGADLWSVLNRVQENLMRGGLSRRSASGRLTRTRRISSIREDVRINSGLWDLASGLLSA